jgi:hypothetical protein
MLNVQPEVEKSTIAPQRASAGFFEVNFAIRDAFRAGGLAGSPSLRFGDFR